MQVEQQEPNYDWESKQDDMPFQYHMIAGCAAGLIEHSLMLPFDSIKTHQQVSKQTNILEIVKHIYNKGGLKSFYRGIQVVASGCMPAHAAYFSVYEYSKIKFNIDDDNLHPYLFGLTGAIATFSHDLILTPIDVIKQRQQITMQNSKQVFKQIKAQEGMFSLLRSFKITYIMNAPQTAILMAVNESLKVLSFAKDQHNFLTYMTCAGIAGGVAALTTTPLDVIKTRLQTQKSDLFNKSQKISTTRSNNKQMNSKPQFASSTFDQNPHIKYRTFKDTANTIFNEEGYKGFFRGASTRIFVIAPSAAISWAAYEQFKKMLFKYQQKPY